MARYSIDLGEEFEQRLKELAKTKGVPMSEIIRRAVASYDYFVTTKRMRPDTKVSITNDADEVIKDVVLP